MLSFQLYVQTQDGSERDRADEPSIWLFDTVLRGVTFLGFQAYEYITSLFTISDSVYGSVFFSLTGLHGIHVFIGALMLAITMFLF